MRYEEKLELIQKEFTALDAFDRLNELIAWSAKLPEGTPELLQEENLFQGCQSKVWLTVDSRNGVANVNAYSDTRIIRGVLALLRELFNGQSTEDIPQGGDDLLEQLSIGYLFSETRRNGVRSICKKIQDSLSCTEN